MPKVKTKKAAAKRFKMTGLYNPPAILDEFCELLSKTKIDFSWYKATSAKEMPAKPEPTIK